MIERFIRRADCLSVGHYIVRSETVGADTAIICIRSIEHIGDDVIINDEMTMSFGTEIICLGKMVVVK